MPFLMQPEAFARRALRAIDRGRPYATIPWPMALVSKLLHVLPRAWYDPIMARQRRKPRKRPVPNEP
jgi:short-subunit dehydrogenase